MGSRLPWQEVVGVFVRFRALPVVHSGRAPGYCLTKPPVNDADPQWCEQTLRLVLSMKLVYTILLLIKTCQVAAINKAVLGHLYCSPQDLSIFLKSYLETKRSCPVASAKNVSSQNRQNADVPQGGGE
jgi:hypothetical protein